MKVDIAGVQIDNVSKVEAITKIHEFVKSQTSHFVVTPYSEIMVFAMNDAKYREALNRADLSLADGIGVLLAARFFGTRLKERVVGRELVFDIAKLAVANNFSLALVGASENTAELAAERLRRQFPNLKINLATNGGYPFDEKTIEQINASNSDILLMAYSPPRQEFWLYENHQKLNTKVAIGLGGTFDYLAGKYAVAPKFMQQIGLEWLWRLITQPWRIKRIWNAVPVFIWKVCIFKLKKGTTSSD